MGGCTITHDFSFLTYEQSYLMTSPYKHLFWLIVSGLCLTMIVGGADAKPPEQRQGHTTAVPPSLPTLIIPPARTIIQLHDQEYAGFLAQATAVLHRPAVPLLQYQHAFTGLVLELSGTELNQIARLPQVKAVYPDREHTLLSDAGPAWIGAPSIWNGSAGLASRGEGVIVGVIDTGVNADHPSFADIGGDGYNHQNPWGNGQYTGVCDPNSSQYDPAFTCNDKLIGAWNFADGPEDNHGHGSHVASIVAGNVVSGTLTNPAGFTYQDVLSGVAPHANLIIYDACTAVCFTSSLLAAIDQAAADGVNTLVFAISGGQEPYHDPVELALLAANEAGIFVAAAGGINSALMQHQGPWVMTAVASTHNRTFASTLVDLTSDQNTLPAIVGTGLTPAYGPAPIVYAGDFGDANCALPFPTNTWTGGEIVVCDGGTTDPLSQGANARAGGAGGLVWVAPSAYKIVITTAAYGLPATHISYADGLVLKTWLMAGQNHAAAITATAVTDHSAAADILAGFNPTMLPGKNILKPDVVAPGIDIWAATKSTLPISPPEYAVESGASPAAAHLAGAAVLLQAIHPDWSPDEIRSALSMTAVTTPLRLPDGFTAANPFTGGAGRLNLTAAARAGLVLDETLAHYQAAATGNLETLNLPALVASACFQSCTWTRIVRSTLDTPVAWSVTAVTPADLPLAISPAQFTITPGDIQTVTITADVTSFFTGQGWGFGEIRLTAAGQPTLHLPVAVQKATTNAPGALAKTGPTFAAPGQTLTYEIRLDNLDAFTHTFTLTDTLPIGMSYVPGSATGGLVYDPQQHLLTWQGSLGPGTRGYRSTAVYPPLPYLNLGDLEPTPPNLCDFFPDCDDTAVEIDLSPDTITFYDEPLSTLSVSSNGVLLGPEANLESGCHPCPQRFPQPQPLNHVIAGLWRDLDPSSSGAWYVAYVDGWLPGETVLYANWHDVGQWGAPLQTSRHAIAIPLDGKASENGRIYFLYDHIADPAGLLAHGYTIGVENTAGSEGLTIAHAPCPDSACLASSPVGAPPTNHTMLRLDPAIVGGRSAHIFTYQVYVTAPANTLLSNIVTVTSNGPVANLTAVADTQVTYRLLLPLIYRVP